MNKYRDVEISSNHTFVNLEEMYVNHTFKRNKKNEVVESMLFLLKRKLLEQINKEKDFLSSFNESLSFFSKYIGFCSTNNFDWKLNINNIGFIRKSFFKDFGEEWFLSLNPLYYDLKKEGLTKGEENRLNKMLVALFMRHEEFKRKDRKELKFYEKLFALEYTNFKYYVLHGALGNEGYLKSGSMVPSNNVKTKKIMVEMENYIDKYILKENIFSVLTDKKLEIDVKRCIEKAKDYLHFYEKEDRSKFKFNYEENLNFYLEDCLKTFNKKEFLNFIRNNDRW